MSNDIFATVVSQSRTPFGYKCVISTHTTSLIAFDNEDEAHYVCAIINTKIVRDYIKSFSSAGRGFGSPSIMEYIGIPSFNLENSIHVKLANNSKLLHKIKLKDFNDNIVKYEKENNELVSALFKKIKR